jgi:hypothetical protein
MFDLNAETQLPSAKDFRLASFEDDWNIQKIDLHNTIVGVMDKYDFTSADRQQWNNYLNSFPTDISEVTDAKTFSLPAPQNGAVSFARHKHSRSVQVNNGIRKKGDFVILQIEVSNCPAYQFNFVIAKLIADVTNVDTTKPETALEFQIFRSTTLDNIGSKIIPWIGDTNKSWKESFARGHVKAIVDIQVKGKKLSAKLKKKWLKIIFFKA